MNYLFYKCQSLISLPPISNWNIKDEASINDMFFECKSLKSLINIHKFMISNIIERTIIYTFEKNTKSIRLFGDIFVKNNNNNCYLLIDGQRVELCTEFKLNKQHKTNCKLQIKLVVCKLITNLNSMFYDCKFLYSLPDIPYWDIKHVTDISGMFNGCSSLQSLPDYQIFLIGILAK